MRFCYRFRYNLFIIALIEEERNYFLFKDNNKFVLVIALLSNRGAKCCPLKHCTNLDRCVKHRGGLYESKSVPLSTPRSRYDTNRADDLSNPQIDVLAPLSERFLYPFLTYLSVTRLCAPLFNEQSFCETLTSKPISLIKHLLAIRR